MIYHFNIELHGDAAAWLSARTHNAGVVSSNPASVTIKGLLARKVKGNHLIKSTSLEKTMASATLKSSMRRSFSIP